MTKIDVFDPPMCCSSGVCGPQVDPLLAAFAADVDWLGRQGVTVTRHNLAQEPRAFVSNPVVQQTLLREGDACLPLVLINGEIAARSAYPRRDELARLAGLVATASSMKPKIRLSAAGCCAPGRVLLMAALPFPPTRVMFYTGKGGVGKTSLACAPRWRSLTAGVACSSSRPTPRRTWTRCSA